MFKNEVERKIFFEKMLPVFSFTEETVQRLKEEIEKPNIDDPVLKDFLNNENNYRLVLQPSLKELAKYILLKYTIPFGYEAYQAKDYQYITEKGMEIDNGINNRIQNYELVISKNIKDFIFCSSTGGFTSCYSLYSEYDVCAWRGIPTLFLDPTQFILYIRSKDKDKHKIELYGLEADKMSARVFIHSAMLSDNNKYRKLLAGRIFGEYTIMITCLLATKIPGYHKIYTLESNFATAYSFLLKRSKPAICNFLGKEVHPYYDRIKFKNGNRYLCTGGSEHYNTIDYDGGISFDKLYHNNRHISDKIGDGYNSEGGYDQYCDICGDGYYEDDEFCNFYDSVDLGNGPEGRVLCDDCRSRLINPTNEYDLLTVLDYNIHLAFLWDEEYAETSIGNCDLYRDIKNEIIPEINNNSSNAYNVLKEVIRLDGKELHIEDNSIDRIYDIKIHSTCKSKEKLLTELWHNNELQKTPESRSNFKRYDNIESLLEKAYDPGLILLEVADEDKRQVIQLYLAKEINTEHIKVIFNNAITEYNKNLGRFDMIDPFIYFVDYIIAKPTKKDIEDILYVPRADGRVLSLSKVKNKGKTTFHDRFNGDVTKINIDEGGYTFKARPRAVGVYDL